MPASRAPAAPEVSAPASAVRLERHGGVAVLRLDDPATMNALSPAVKAGMLAHVPAILADDGVRCIVLTGTGKAFCAGGDIRSMQDKAARAPVAMKARMEASHVWSRALLDTGKPIIAAINGAAVGGGLAMALLADIIYVAPEAYFMGGYAKLGALPDLGLLQTLTWAVGSLRAKEIILLNRRVSADEAVAIGLANRIIPADRLMEETLAAARQIAEGPAPMLQLSKQLMKRVYENSVEEFHEREALGQAVAFNSPEFDEGVAAFMGKRKPRFVK